MTEEPRVRFVRAGERGEIRGWTEIVGLLLPDGSAVPLLKATREQLLEALRQLNLEWIELDRLRVEQLDG